MVPLTTIAREPSIQRVQRSTPEQHGLGLDNVRVDWLLFKLQHF